MKLLLFEDKVGFGTTVSRELVTMVPNAEVLWFGTVENREQPEFPDPFDGGRPTPLRGKGLIVTATGSTEREIDVWPGELAGAVLDIYLDRIKVGEGIASWLDYAHFSGPVLMYSGYNLPPALPALPKIFLAQKTEDLTSLMSPLKAFRNMLDPDAPIARVNSRGVPPGGGDQVKNLCRRLLVWNWLNLDASMDPITHLFGPGEKVTDHEWVDKPLLASNRTVEDLAEVRKASHDNNPFYLIMERNKDVEPIQALKYGVVYLDATKLLEAPLRYAVETAEEFLCRYNEIVRRYPGKCLGEIQPKDGPILASFLIVYIRALAFSSGSRALYTADHDKNRPAWIEGLTGEALPQTFERAGAKKKLLQSAKALHLIPVALELP